MTGHANGNPIALVTGAGVRIGRQIAERLAKEGYGVAVHVRCGNPQAIEVVEHIRALGRDATLIEGDLEDDDAAAPSEIADAVVYLAQAESVTGQMIAVDGGQHLVWQTLDVSSALE